jgi:hypothetical protein
METFVLRGLQRVSVSFKERPADRCATVLRMRNTLPLSLAAWATAAMTALSFAACAKSVNSDLSDTPTGSSDGDSGASTQQASGSVDGGGNAVSSSNGGDPSSSSGGDAGGTSSNDDAGSTSSDGDSGSTSSEDAGGSSGGEDSGGSSGGGVQGQTNCPMTTKYANEFSSQLNASDPTICFSGTDCTTAQCCYLGLIYDGLCVDL